MKKNTLYGILYSASGSLFWGTIGVFYFKFVAFAGPIELVIHRTIWTAILLLFTTSYYSKWNKVKQIVTKKTNIIIFFFTGILISINWFTWLYAVQTNNLLDGALGYYIFPILSVFFGFIFLKEKLNNPLSQEAHKQCLDMFRDGITLAQLRQKSFKLSTQYRDDPVTVGYQMLVYRLAKAIYNFGTKAEKEAFNF